MRWSTWAAPGIVAIAALSCTPERKPSLPPTPDATADDDDDPLPPPAQSFVDRYCAGAPRLFLETEEFTGPWAVQTNKLGFSGDGFVVSNANGVADTSMCRTVSAPDPGTYAVWARGYRSSGTAREFSVSIDGQRLAPTHAAVASPQDDGFHWEEAGSVPISSRATSLEVCVHDDGTSYEVADAILLTRDLDCDPSAYDRDLRVLDPVFARDMMRQEVLGRAASYRDAVPEPTTLAEWTDRRTVVLDELSRALGFDQWPDLSDRSPLNVKTYGSRAMDGYSIVRMSFESQPGLVVPANLYLPDGDGPFPVIVHPVGHWGASKAATPVSVRMQTLARFGYLGITYDPFGQGERAVPGNGHDEHFRLLLSGSTNTAFMVWDTIRAVDAALERPEADPTRIGITGASGGGLNTLYAMLFDERIGFAAPAIYVSSIYDFMATHLGHDPCSRNPIGAFTDRGEVMALFAPKPMLQIVGDFDALFPAGEQSAALAEDVYGLYGARGAFEVALDDVGHELSFDLRDALYNAVTKHLGRGAPEPVEDMSLPPPPADALRVFSSGLPASRRVADYALEMAEQHRSRLSTPETFEPETFRARVFEELRVPIAGAPGVEDGGEFILSGRRIEKLAVTPSPNVGVPVLYIDHDDPSVPVVVLLERGILPDIAVVGVADRGVAAAVVSLRGEGETVAPRDFYFTQNNIILQDPMLALRAHDLHQAARAIRARVGDRSMVLFARGLDNALIGLVAQSLWLDFDKAVIDGVMGSWMDAFGEAFPDEGYVHRILMAGDIPHFIERARLRPLLVVQSDARSLAVHWPEWAEHQADVLRHPRPTDQTLFEWMNAP